MNYFKLLDLKESYDIDFAALNQNYFSRQEVVHPDREGGMDSSLAMDLNTAYTTLKNDLSRAQYLLKLKGFDLSDSEQRKILSREDLEEIWEDLSTVEDESDVQRLRELLELKNSLKKQLVNNIGLAFKKDDVKDALDITIRLKYLINLIENIKQKLSRVHL